MAFIEDARVRLSVHTHSALGVASLDNGWLEVKLDRRLDQDDNRGLGQGVTDSRLTQFKVSRAGWQFFYLSLLCCATVCDYRRGVCGQHAAADSQQPKPIRAHGE